MNKTVVVGFDVDGTLSDSLRECYNRCCETWQGAYHKNYPYSYEEFKAFRHHVMLVEDFFAIPVIAQNGHVSSDVGKDLPAVRKNGEVVRMKDLFYSRRKAKQDDNMSAWLDESPLYDGILEMFDEIKGMKHITPIAITSKDKVSVDALLKHRGVKLEAIYDKSVGERPTQYIAVMRDFQVEPSNIAVYDDMGDILRTARKLGIFPLAAPQGYDDPESISEFRKALPREVPHVLREVFE